MPPGDRTSGSAFPLTQASIVHALTSESVELRERAFSTLVAIYWKPVYKYIRFRWNLGHEDGEDLTQDFFRLAFEKDWLSQYDATRARFRTFIRTCVDGLVGNWRRAAQRTKRGGSYTRVPMDFGEAEREFLDTAPAPDADVEAFFQAEWVRAVFELSIARLRTECQETGKEQPFALFVRYDVEGAQMDQRPSYAELARDFNVPLTQVTNFLALARRRFRHHVLQALAELTGSQEEYAEAVRDLLGITPT